jgi:hypothetical protein
MTKFPEQQRIYMKNLGLGYVFVSEKVFLLFIIELGEFCPLCPTDRSLHKILDFLNYLVPVPPIFQGQNSLLTKKFVKRILETNSKGRKMA